jgi:nitroimidazol reductase NimA-like FMN-containing flavoprotein (pyridoxamine 5'-phosphate oxidase superfamily)
VADRQPVAERNLDGYGSPPIAWERARQHLEEEWRLQGPAGEGIPHTHWLATVRPDGTPHVMPVGAVWLDGDFYFTTGAGTRKARNLAHNPRCVITLAAPDLDVVVEGEAVKVTDEATLQRLAQTYADHGWAPTVREGAFYHEFSAPSAGPPPWDLYKMTPTTVFGLATSEPSGATRWRFA